MSNPLIASQYDRSGQIHASVVVALDTHQVKTISSSQNLDVVFNLEKDNRVCSIQWIPFQADQQLIALSLTNGSILLYSPFENSIITRLTTRTNFKITDFQYSSLTNSFWGSDINGVIYEWDIYYNFIQQFSINDTLEVSEAVNKFLIINYNNCPHILVGCHSIYLVDIKTKSIIKTFPGHIDLISCILTVPSNPDLFLTSAIGDRFINLYSISKNTTKMVFVSESPVIDIDIGVVDDKSCLVARTETGDLQVFNSILSEDVSVSNSKKKRRQQLSNKSRNSNGSIILKKHSDDIKGSTTPNLYISTIKISNNSILYSWLENVNIRSDFQSWIADDVNYSITSVLEVVKKAVNKAGTSHLLAGQDVASTTHYNEGNTIVSDGYNLNHVVEGDDEEEEGETLAEQLEKLSTEVKPVISKKRRGLNNNNTLTIILSQALKSNDQSLLDNVLGNKDQQVIQNTIARLDSSLAILLLDRISEKLARQAGKFDQLVYWIKWIIIIHGSILSSLPGLSSKLSNLHGILTKKADTLPRLMQLKGKMNIIYETAEIKAHETSIIDSDVDTDVEYIEELDDGLDHNDDSSGDDMDLDMIDNIAAHDDYEESDESLSSDEEVGMVTKEYIDSDEEDD